LQGFPVLEQLLVGFIEVGVFAFVLPGKETFGSDIGKVGPALLFGDPGLKGELLAGGVVIGGGGVVDQLAQVEKMFLGGGTFLKLDVAPFVDKFLRIHRRPLRMMEPLYNPQKDNTSEQPGGPRGGGDFLLRPQ
jgi:hypothetical protein